MAPKRPFPFGKRTFVIFVLLGLGVLSWNALGIQISDLVPGEGGAKVVVDFFSHAVKPAVGYESEVPSGTKPLLVQALHAALRTVVFAAAAMTLSLLIGFLLGFPASTSWWSGNSSYKANHRFFYFMIFEKFCCFLFSCSTYFTYN